MRALETVSSVTVLILFSQVEADKYAFDIATGQNDVQKIIDAAAVETEVIWIGPDHAPAYGTGMRFEAYTYFNHHPERLLDFLARNFSGA